MFRKVLNIFSKGEVARDPPARATPAVNFEASRVNAAVLEDVHRTLASMPEMPSPVPLEVANAARRCVETGGDLSILFNALRRHLPDTVPRRTAEEMVRFVNARARSIMDRHRQLDLGIVEAKWAYSNAPCTVSFISEPQDMAIQDAAHKAADGRAYKVAEGLMLAGKQTWPGMEPGCKCMSRSTLPGI